LLTGLADAGPDLTDADLVVGTSAGSVVGAQVTSSTPLRELYDRQLEPASSEQAARAARAVIAAILNARICPSPLPVVCRQAASAVHSPVRFASTFICIVIP
ncbi:MAG: hypothetical protein H0X53_09250, partial [Sphingomonas sp.]|nr:hypothetical protein [Sphingomonas sp.]